MYKLVISDDEGKTTVVPLVRDEVSIGRKEGNTIRLTERNVSRKHARLRKTNGNFVLEDMSSYNGVKLNGKRIEGQVDLKAGDQLMIGDYVLALHTEAPQVATAILSEQKAIPDDATTAVVATPETPQPPARLVMLSPPAPGAEFALSRPDLRVGRGEDLDIWVNHRSISREHAQIVQDADGFKIIDLGSANGIRVNRKPVQSARLEQGDVVELGQVRFRYVGQGQSYVFDADRTVQMDALEAEQASRRLPAMAAIGVLMLMLGVAGGIAWYSKQPKPRSPQKTASMIVHEPKPEVPIKVAVAEEEPNSITSCKDALAEGDIALALEQAERALKKDPNSEEARACRNAADDAFQKEAFIQAIDMFRAGRVDESYQVLARFPEDSIYRKKPEYQTVSDRFALNHLRAGQGVLARDPAEALRQVEMVLAVPETNVAVRQQALRVKKLASKPTANIANTSPEGQSKKAPPSTRNPSSASSQTAQAAPSTEDSEGEVSALLEQARACVRRGDNQCVVRTLEGKTHNPRELALLIETYRLMGDRDAAMRHMSDFVRRYPTASKAQAYKQILARYEN